MTYGTIRIRIGWFVGFLIGCGWLVGSFVRQ